MAGVEAVVTRRQEFTRKETILWKLIAGVQSSPGQERSMRRMIKRIATGIGATVWSDKGNVYAVKGTPPDGQPYPCVVAHMDTVHPIIPQQHYEVRRSEGGEWIAVDTRPETDKDGNPVIYYAGIGGDDKCGIWLALDAMRVFPFMKAAFFREEETGCKGSHDADAAFFGDCAFVLQGDRRGNGDFVNRIGGDLQSTEFEREVKPLLDRHGYKGNVWGAPTDVGALKGDGLKLSVANMSCGYWDPHQGKERVVEADLITAKLLIGDVVIAMGDRAWPHEQKKVTYVHGRHDWDDDAYGYHGWNRAQDEKEIAALGYVRDADGLWVLPPEREAEIVAEIAAHPGRKNVGGACVFCGAGFTSWENGLYVCRPSEWYVKNKEAGPGCGKTQPITQHAFDWKKTTADKLNRSRKREMERAAQAAKKPTEQDGHATNAAPIVLPATTGGDAGTALVTTTRTATCVRCAASGGRLLWSTTQCDWWCPDCNGYEHDTDQAYTQREAARIVSAMIVRGDLDWIHEFANPLTEEEMRGVVASWLADGHDKDQIIAALKKGGDDRDTIDDHDGHESGVYRTTRPDACATCGDTGLVYDTGEDAFLCLSCRAHTIALPPKGLLDHQGAWLYGQGYYRD